MAINQMIAQGIAPIGQDVPNILAQMEQMQQGRQRNALMQQGVLVDQQNAGTSRLNAMTNYQRQQADMDGATREQVGHALDNLETIQDEAQFNAAADEYAAHPLAQQLGVTRAELTRQGLPSVRAKLGLPAPDPAKYGAPFDAVDQQGPGMFRPGPGGSAVRIPGLTPPTPRPLVQVNTGDKAEDAAAMEYAKIEGKAFSDTLQAASDATAEYDQLGAMLDSPAITGPTQDFRAAANSFFADLGVPIAPAKLDQITNLAQYKGIQGSLVLGALAKQKGPQTEGDAKRATETYGNTKTIQEANRAVVRYQRALADRKMEIARIAEDYKNSQGKITGWRRVVDEYVRSTPLNGIDPDSKRLVFFNEFKQGIKENNPNMPDEEIIKYWRDRYGKRR